MCLHLQLLIELLPSHLFLLGLLQFGLDDRRGFVDRSGLLVSRDSTDHTHRHKHQLTNHRPQVTQPRYLIKRQWHKGGGAEIDREPGMDEGIGGVVSIAGFGTAEMQE